MTFKALTEGIKRLVIARAKAHGDDAEQARINVKLNKLYAIKRTMLAQMAAGRA